MHAAKYSYVFGCYKNLDTLPHLRAARFGGVTPLRFVQREGGSDEALQGEVERASP